MGFHEDFGESGLLETLRDVYHKQSVFYRNLRETAERELGRDATAAIKSGLVEYGRWRAMTNRAQSAVVVAGDTPSSWLANWECADFLMFSSDPGLRVSHGPSSVSVAMSAPPELSYFQQHGQSEWLYDFWEWTLQGLSDEFARLTARADRSDDAIWTIAFEGEGIDEAAASLGEAKAVFAAPVRAIELIRQSSIHNGALYFFLARAIFAAYDASGEASIRSGVRAIGRERGEALRADHLRRGLPLNIKTEMDNWDGPLVSVWQWREEGTLTPNVWKQECTWCPYASAWNQFGAEGQKFGYLYDVELHTTLYNTYLPGTLVRWETLKTRGDATCGFRIEASDEVIAAAAATD
ncbi:hypothetical protein [Sinomonas humi]|uniref:L-2-amino-thiazoline-4-carboxylic acid hydrolase n=1 Tax=Sinomonas humi TaxID=1338436 RepID=A0A0B2ALE8_9MICC|nr:hypothetical protein [Sinomonas humi]KHL02736.1 hypothetical protein LK10_11605 [Sinomonas humi]